MSMGSKTKPEETPRPKPKEFLSGASAAFTNICITFPINKVIFRQQLHGIGTGAALNELKREGFTNLYRGLFPPLAQKTTSMSIMFGMFEHYKRYLAHHTNLSLKSQEAVAAMIAGCMEAVLCPFERIQVLMQDKQYHGQFRNTVHTAVTLRSYGIAEYYRGMSCILLRNGPSNVAFFLLRKPIKHMFPTATSEYQHVLQDFLSGAVLGASISTVCYPINVVKTRMQSKLGGKFDGIVKTFLIVFRERNYSLRKMFHGVRLNFTRSLLSWGIINASYEFYTKFYSRILVDS